MSQQEALVIGAGPAGLMAAQELAQAGLRVTIAEAMPSPGRKFLMAGKSGLNLTKDEPASQFASAYGASLPPALSAALADFGPKKVQAWAEALGQEVFTGSSKRVFPKAMKASPLLRAWLRALEAQGVQLNTRWRWTGWDEGGVTFDTPDGAQTLNPAVTVLALGGASWARLGSNGAWAAQFGDECAPFAATNAGLAVNWSAHMERHFGQPIKGISIHAGDEVSRGEFIISSKGLEGGGIYALSQAVRAAMPLLLDLAPDQPMGQVAAKLAMQPSKFSLSNRLRKALGLTPAKIALLQEWGRPLPKKLAPLIKNLPIHHAGLRPIDEAISTAGGMLFGALDEGLMLRAKPGVFAAGEMLDWEAPTGGYLITGSLATGRMAGQNAARYAQGLAS